MKRQGALQTNIIGMNTRGVTHLYGEYRIYTFMSLIEGRRWHNGPTPMKALVGHRLIATFLRADIYGKVTGTLRNITSRVDIDSTIPEQSPSLGGHLIHAWQMFSRSDASGSSNEALCMYFVAWICWCMTYVAIQLIPIVILSNRSNTMTETKRFTTTWYMKGNTNPNGRLMHRGDVDLNSLIGTSVCIITTTYLRNMDQLTLACGHNIYLDDAWFNQILRTIGTNAVEMIKDLTLDRMMYTGHILTVDFEGRVSIMYNYGEGMIKEAPYDSHEWAMDSRNGIISLPIPSSTCEACHISVITITLEGGLWTTVVHIEREGAHFGKERPPPEPPPILLPPPEPPPREGCNSSDVYYA